MVKEIEHKGKKYYQCEACEMYYNSRELVQKCENFCNDKKSCNTEIIKHAVQLD